MRKSATGEPNARTDLEEQNDKALLHLAQSLLPKYGSQWNVHSLVTLKRQAISRVVYYYELYQKIVHVPGMICEFGVQWGATLNLLINLRGMLEPNNYSRIIYGFDTFSGFASVTDRDGSYAVPGDLRTLADYENTLDSLLKLQEFFSRPSHFKNFGLIKGDATVTVPKWLETNSHAIIAMAIFDMDVYAPTKEVIENILPRLTKGSLLVFDELNCPYYPGETIAVSETLGLNNITLRRFPHQPYCAWAVFGE
jgi:hypothetical protein